jgi:hypothetical protein
MAENRGGARTGQPGRNYPNRSDLAGQPAQTTKGQDYGEAGAQLDAQSVIPVAGAPSGGASQPSPMAGMVPGSIPSLSDPSANPNEPITAGLASGPGPGPEALTMAQLGPEELSILRGIFLKFPNDDLRRQIQWTEQNLA